MLNCTFPFVFFLLQVSDVRLVRQRRTNPDRDTLSLSQTRKNFSICFVAACNWPDIFMFSRNTRTSRCKFLPGRVPGQENGDKGCGKFVVVSLLAFIPPCSARWEEKHRGRWEIFMYEFGFCTRVSDECYEVYAGQLRPFENAFASRDQRPAMQFLPLTV